MTRGIVELAAERLAASAAAAPPAEPADQVLGRSNASPRRTSRSTGTGGRSSGLGSRAQGSAGTRPGAGSRPPLASRPPAGPPEAVRPPADMARLDAETYPEPFTWATHPDERSDEAPEAGYPRIANRPAAGLPESVRLPAELPDNCWPPHALLERHSTENIYVPAPVLPDAEPAAPAEKVTEELPGARLYVPPRPVEPAQEPEPEPEPDSAFLPTVLARDEEEAPDYVPSRSRDRTARHAASPAGPSTRTRRRRAVLLAYVLVVAVVLVIGHQLRNDEQPIAPGREAAQRAAEPAGPAPTDVPAAAPQAVEAEAGEFRYAKGRGPMLGTGGRVHRFQVAVEKTVDGPAPADFADEIDRTLGDERSWISEGDVRLRRVPRSAGNADFTIYLASATTSEQMCATAGLQTAGFTSCRVPGKVIINADRWADGIPDYAGHLAEYRRYAINHEVGHELGHGHELCPGEGRPAPVMMQQTYGLKGCTRNAWPYLDGERYAGEPTA